MSDKIPLSPPQVNGKEWEYVKAVLDSGDLTPNGPQVAAFEKEIAQRCKVPFAVATASGTSALHIALELLEIGPGDLVFCSDLTFVASANAILYQRAQPVFIDSEPATWNMSPAALRQALQQAKRDNRLPKAVLAADIFGSSCDHSKLQALCDEFSVPLIEDAAEALGSCHKGRPCGSFGNMGVISFNSNKIITSGGGGMLLTHDSRQSAKAKFLITQAKDDCPWYQHSTVGYNYRMGHVNAAIGRAQLLNLDERIRQRRQLFCSYQEALGPKGAVFIPQPEDSFSNCWLSAFYFEHIDNTSDIIAKLNTDGIEARHIWKPMHMQPLFRDCPVFHHEDNASFSRFLFEKGLCLPSAFGHSREMFQRVVSALLATIGDGIRATERP